MTIIVTVIILLFSRTHYNQQLPLIPAYLSKFPLLLLIKIRIARHAWVVQ